MTTTFHRALASHVLDGTSDQLLLPDGSIWSHAATLGTYVRDNEFTIDQTMIENFVRVFTSGYPQKIPVDYEHGTVNGATLRGQPVPKAGDVLELKGVFATEDFTGDLRSTAEKLTAKADRALDDERNLGLWMRWKPTPRALGMIQGEEYSDLSIAFDRVPHNATGADQGEVLISIALTNLPFLDTMLPVAASRDLGGSPSATGSREEQSMSNKMLAATTALTGKAVTTEDEGVTELNALSTELRATRDFTAVLSAEIGEKDPAKAVASIRALKATNATLTAKAKDEQKARIATSVESFLKTHEKRIASVPLKNMFARQLTGELDAAPDTKVEETETGKTVAGLPETGTTERASGADIGGEKAGDDVKLDAKAKELMNSDAELKELSRVQGFNVAFPRALSMAREQLGMDAKKD